MALSVSLTVLLAPPGCKSGQQYAQQLRSPDPVEKQEAFLYFSRPDRVDKLTVEILRSSLAGGEKNALVRAAAASALGELGDRGHVHVLIKALADESWLVRFDAVVAKGRLGDPRAVAPLVERLRMDPHVWARLKAARALAQLKSPAAIPALIEALEDKDPSVRSPPTTRWRRSPARSSPAVTRSGKAGSPRRGRVSRPERRRIEPGSRLSRGAFAHETGGGSPASTCR